MHNSYSFNQFNELSHESEQLANWLLNPADQNDFFGPALISSPSATCANTLISSELIGGFRSTNTDNKNGGGSCYSTPLSSPPSSMADPLMGGEQFPLRTDGMPGLNNNSLVKHGTDQPGKIPSFLRNQPTGSCGSQAITADSDYVNDSRKRKSIRCGISKETPSSSCHSASDNKVGDEYDESRTVKRSEQDDCSVNRNNRVRKKSKNDKVLEPPKDCVHVRARRGQATDSHSLAERVRREKISERMKMLQNLVPGCDKVTGKALMLDEIINYVQSLQRQVEFLSMKLAYLHPAKDLNPHCLSPKAPNPSQMIQMGEFMTQNIYPASSPEPGFCSGYESLKADGTSCLEAIFSSHPSRDRFNGHLHVMNLELPTADASARADPQSQFQEPLVWENDLQSIVRTGFRQDKPLSSSHCKQSPDPTLC